MVGVRFLFNACLIDVTMSESKRRAAYFLDVLAKFLTPRSQISALGLIAAILIIYNLPPGKRTGV